MFYSGDSFQFPLDQCPKQKDPGTVVWFNLRIVFSFNMTRSRSRSPRKSIRAEEELDSLNYVYNDPVDPSLRFLYRPHTVTVLIAILSFFLYSALFQSQTCSSVGNVLRGLAAAATVFCFYGVTQLRDGPFIRPHPVFWRAVQAISVVYLILLVFLFFQVLRRIENKAIRMRKMLDG